MTDTREAPETLLKNAIFVLLAYAAVMGGVAGYQAYQASEVDSLDRGKFFPLLLWGAANCVVALAAAFWAWSYKPPVESRTSPTAPTKLLFLAIGGFLGFFTVVFLGVGYVILWWDDLIKARSAWKETKPWIPVALILGGLAVMLISVLTVRSEERTNVTLRRLIYGYNAVLVGLLVFAILGVGNVMASIYMTRPYDWTETNLYSISEPSKQILERLDVPVKLYVLVLPQDPLYEDVRTLLETAKSYNSLIEVEYIATMLDLRQLSAKYEVPDGTAVYLVYDPAGQAGKPVQQAIKGEELEDLGSRMRSEGQQRSFKGERAIVSAIRSLREGKVNRTLYFTQDSGEMKLTDSGGRRDRPGAIDRGLSALRGRLERSGYTVKELSLGQLDPDTREPAKIPGDAFAVVMAGPTDLGETAAAASKIKVLQDYMKGKDGKLLLLLEAHRNRDGVVQPTGLEAFLGGLGVQVGKDIILHEPFGNLPDPTVAVATTSQQAEVGFQEALGRAGFVYLLETRTIQPATAGAFAPTRLLETVPLMRDATGQWPEDSLQGDPVDFVTNLREKQPDVFTTKRRSPPASVAVTVRDKSGDSAMPDDPVHAPMRQSQGQPRMVIFGSSFPVSNSAINSREVYFDLCAGSLNWLKGREGEVIGEIPERIRRAYRMNLKSEDRTRVLWQPGLALLVGVIACGIGVWFLRRG